MKIKINILTSKLKTDNPEILKALSKLYSFPVPGYQYTKMYKKRRWDGCKSYFSRTGTFKTGLLPRILKDLEKIKAEYTIEKDFDDNECLEVKNIKNIEYYDYQKDVIKHILDNKRGLIIAPTSAGKTLMMAGLVKSLQPKKMVILFKEKGILNQTYDFLTKTCKLKNIGVCSGDGYIYGDVMLSTVQSIEKILDTHLHEAEVLMVDEVHQFGNGDVTIAAIQAFPKAMYRVGFTATLQKEENDIHPRLVLEGAFGTPYISRSTQELIEDGKLAKPIIQIITISHKETIHKRSYSEIYDDCIVYNENRNDSIKSITDVIKKTNIAAKILILVKNLDHVENLMKLIPEAESIEGKNSIPERYEIIARFRDKYKSTILIGTNVMQTGINIEEITHLINGRGLKGEIPTIQGLGRALRMHETKPVVYIYDFYDKIKYLEDHSKQRIKHYKKQGHTVEYL